MNSNAIVIHKDLLDRTTEAAKSSPRQRMNHNFHELTEKVQRFLNAVEPASYVQPHRHQHPPKAESFVLIRGQAAILLFDESGGLTDLVLLSQKLDHFGVEIPPGQYHSLLSLESGTILYEIKEGPYNATTDKDFAPWAPPEGSPEAPGYLTQLKAMAGL